MTEHPEVQRKSIARMLLIGFGVFLLLLVALIFGFKKFLEYTGAKEWEMTQAMLISEGVELDPEKLLPEIPPDAENFAAAPLIAALSWKYRDVEQKKNLNDRFRAMRIPERPSVDIRERKSGLPDFLSQQVTDLEAIALALAEAGAIPQGESGVPERAIQNWLEGFRPEIAELDAASELPFAVWPVPPVFDFPVYQKEFSDYENAYDLNKHHRFQAVRALAALATGEEEEALSALRTMFQISRTLSSQPFVIPQLFSFSSDGLALSVIWEGIKNQEMERRRARANFKLSVEVSCRYFGAA